MLNVQMLRLTRVRTITSACVALVTLASGAGAQTGGFALDRFDPAERGSDWFAMDSLDLRGSERMAVGATGEWGYKPLVAYGESGEELQVLVRHQLFAHVGASLVMWERVRFGVNLPVLVYSRADALTQDGVTVSPADEFTLGDPRLGADVRLFGQYGEVASLALGVRVHLPVGSRDAFASDGKVRIVPRLSFAGQAGVFEYAVQSGINIRTRGDDFVGVPMGSSWEFGGAAGVRLLERRLLVGPEVYGATVISDGQAGFFETQSTPLEGVIGGHYFAEGGLRFGLGAGPGLTRGLGSPQWRVLGSIEWSPAPIEPAPVYPGPEQDTDKDGIRDSRDACVHEPGPVNADPDKHGCPPRDTDRDGILDEDDQCVREPGVASSDPKMHGCPIQAPRDTDGDGIFDEQDACVNEPGQPSEDKQKHGCPLPPDADKDGILDAQDACSTIAGAPSDDPSKHGCPKAAIVGDQIKILERIEFDTKKATIRDTSEGVLNAVLQIMIEHPEIELISIEGHTDNRGNNWFNNKLSRDRAAAVVRWLVQHGVEKSRMTSKGYGPSSPIDSNETDEGRQNNRRVEFHIVKMGKSDVEFKQQE
jgi:OmpA-OmpF porin, OOP family